MKANLEMFKHADYNQNVARRDELLLSYKKYGREDYYCQFVPYALFQTLIAEKFADPCEQQNEAPSIGEILSCTESFVKAGLTVTFEAYAIGIARDDYRVTIEGIRVTPPSGKVVSNVHAQQFLALYRHADDFHWNEKELYAWWD